MADYAGAVAAIRSRLEANWTTTRIAYQNENPAAPWPPVDGSAVLQPWVHLEVECFDSEIHGQGQTDNHVYRYEGLISISVFTPIGVGLATGVQYAVTIGEIFRRKTFYNETSGHAVRTEDPFPAGGGSKSDDGNWFGVTMTCAFVYWFRG